MPWTVETGEAEPRVVLTGQVDIFEAEPLHEALVSLAGDRRRIHVDLSTCSDLDTSALQLLVAFKRTRAAAGAPVSFAWAAGRVGRLLTRFGLEEVLQSDSS